MRSQATTTRALRPIRFGPIESDAARFASLLIGFGIFLTGAVLGARRWAGALGVPLEGPVLVAVVILAALATALARIAWRRPAPPGAPLGLDRAALAAPTVGLLLLAYALSLPDARVWAKTLVWTLLLAQEAASGWWLARRGPLGWPRRSRTGGAPSAGLWHRGERLTQRLARTISAQGDEVLRGSLRADFASGGRTQSVHVAFCPPFARRPRFELRQSAGPPARIQVGQLLPQGARLEVKLSEPARETAAVWVEFTASV